MQFEVDRQDLHRTRCVDEPVSGGTVLRIDAFALTTNNITYAVFGDAMHYWDFFPASGPWGRIPVWGFAETEGRRVYGYLPMGTQLAVEPGRADERGFTDMAAHRRPMAGAYNRYLFTDADPTHDPEREAQQMVLWPLFFTSFLIDDFFADNDLFGASVVVVSSASSKTAIGAAHQLAQRPDLTVVGLTSRTNAAFVGALGCYHDTVTYDEAAKLPDADAVFVDIAGNGDVRAAVHGHYRDRLKHSMVVGSTHWDHESAAPAPDTGPAPTFFFAPTQISKRTREWGQAALDERVAAAWHQYSAWTDDWLRIEHHRGPAAVEAAYRTLLEGRVDPRTGFVCNMEEEPE